MSEHRIERNTRYDSEEGKKVLRIVKKVLPLNGAIRMKEERPNERNNFKFFPLSPIAFEVLPVQANERDAYCEFLAYCEPDTGDEAPCRFYIACEAKFALVAFTDPFTQQRNDHSIYGRSHAGRLDGGTPVARESLRYTFLEVVDGDGALVPLAHYRCGVDYREQWYPRRGGVRIPHAPPPRLDTGRASPSLGIGRDGIAAAIRESP